MSHPDNFGYPVFEHEVPRRHGRVVAMLAAAACAASFLTAYLGEQPSAPTQQIQEAADHAQQQYELLKQALGD